MRERGAGNHTKEGVGFWVSLALVVDNTWGRTSERPTRKYITFSNTRYEVEGTGGPRTSTEKFRYRVAHAVGIRK